MIRRALKAILRVAALPMLLTAGGCGVHCPGLDEDFASCDAMAQAYTDGDSTDPARTRALQQCLEDQCNFIVRVNP